MQKPIQRYLRVIAVFIRTITAFVIVAPVIQFMVGCYDHRLGCRINPAGRRDRRIEGHRDADAELILDLTGRIRFGCQDHDAKINVLPLLLHL